METVFVHWTVVGIAIGIGLMMATSYLLMFWFVSMAARWLAREPTWKGVSKLRALIEASEAPLI